MAPRIHQVDPNLTLTLANAAYEAYYPTIHTPPLGFKYYDQWTGRNPSILGGDVEPYGLIFQGNLPTNSGTFIFAFKGTASFWDAWEDVFVNWTQFKAFQNSDATNQVDVADGFNDVYTAKVTPGQNDSMQDQLFAFLHKIQPKHLIITGHSLGSALAELFSLDIYVSLPSRLFTTQHYNFACPRVGFAKFANLYNQYESRLPPGSQTIRIVNFKDEIPCLPFHYVLGYDHAPAYFLFSFDKASGWWPSYTERHSIFNYWQVLKKVVVASNQEFAGPVTGINGVKLMSEIPANSESECSGWFADYLGEISKELKEHPPSGGY